MKLLFDLVAVQPIHGAKFHGGGSYGEAVFRALARAGECELFCAYDAKKRLNPELLELCREKGIALIDVNEKSPQQMVDENGIDTFYTPLYSLEGKWRLNVPRYLFTWHGVRALELRYDSIGLSFAKSFARKVEALVRYRESWKRWFYKPKYSAVARRIAATARGEAPDRRVETMTVSEHSRASIKGFFPELAGAEIPVFYSPMEEAEPDASIGLPEGAEPRKYFLLTSGARWEKNNLRAVLAFDELASDYAGNGLAFPYKLVLTGAVNKAVYARRIRNAEAFAFLDYVETAELEFLHQNAYAFVFPSLNEGFGYPPLQSMRYGVPVAASGTTSIPEVCQSAALYFDPYSVSEIKNRMIQLLDPAIHAEYALRARKRYGEVRARQEEDLKKTVAFVLGEKRSRRVRHCATTP